MTIPFNKPYLTGKELTYIQEAVNLGKISGNGEFTRRCQDFFENRYGFHKCLLTTSCTDALEMAAILLDIQPGDEVILPSFTFVSSANAFVLRGAKIVFIDSKPDHPNLDESLLEELITPKTKAIVVVHYGGLACEMERIMDIAERHNLFVVEDAAQAIDSFYKGKALGGIGHLACFSFHETKNIQCGEGGMLVVNDPDLVKRAEIIWEKGTDRAAFFRGEIDKYGWVDVGSSFLPSEVTAAFLWAQLENLDMIQDRRMEIWDAYFQFFNEGNQNQKLSSDFLGLLQKASEGLPFHTAEREYQANAHLFYLIFDFPEDRSRFAQRLKENHILSVFHYQSLHRSRLAKAYFPDQSLRVLPNSDRFSDSLIRLPLFYELTPLPNVP
ncbi:dTDP-4-amino-4,6-dideoxygalactose transaminase [Algoriphagus lacus]|uniref:dTDP-4-amino-4,6-dideoxygalactose transaminase n=1 Tax=Algoriphagus lacus TaxID=2056311 RepID=A0A418PLM0_9BACT|nr:dTDP-4-amino-4,6-dideoxygalactose transaminase [Algoriphagus lacus]RIW12275.1 dTDP-4-amino-4,6-dideoxygalactose transaminase [Algoriphagus lacus]